MSNTQILNETVNEVLTLLHKHGYVRNRRGRARCALLRCARLDTTPDDSYGVIAKPLCVECPYPSCVYDKFPRVEPFHHDKQTKEDYSTFTCTYCKDIQTLPILNGRLLPSKGYTQINGRVWHQCGEGLKLCVRIMR